MAETKEKKETIEIDAAGRKLGRLATEVATYLMGKHRVDFRRNEIANVEVHVKNAAKLSISNQKLKSKEYVSNSGYPGGKKVKTAEELAQEKGFGEVIRRAVDGMLPKNKLRDRILKNLYVEE